MSRNLSKIPKECRFSTPTVGKIFMCKICMTPCSKVANKHCWQVRERENNISKGHRS